MSKMWVHGIALVLLLVSLPLISIGTVQDSPSLWWSGLGLLVAAGAVTPVTRYLLEDDEGDDDGGDEDDDEPDTGEE